MCVIITDSKDLCQLERGIRNQTQVLKSCTQMWGADNQSQFLIATSYWLLFVCFSVSFLLEVYLIHLRSRGRFSEERELPTLVHSTMGSNQELLPAPRTWPIFCFFPGALEGSWVGVVQLVLEPGLERNTSIAGGGLFQYAIMLALKLLFFMFE